MYRHRAGFKKMKLFYDAARYIAYIIIEYLEKLHGKENQTI